MYRNKQTIYAPTYANILMTEPEEKYKYPLIKNISILHFQYIDNIFNIWKGNYDYLATFLHNINKQHLTIKFDFLISGETVPFLDTKVYIDKELNIEITVYLKETDLQSSLHRMSEHPLYLKKSISFSQASKLKRIFSIIIEFEDESAKIIQKVVEIGCKTDDIKGKNEQASNIAREILLQKTQNNNNVNRIPLTLSDNGSTPNVSQIIKKFSFILKINGKLAKAFVGDQIIFLKQTRNLGEIIERNVTINNKKENMNGNVTHTTAGKAQFTRENFWSAL